MQRKKEVNLRLEACYEKAYVPNYYYTKIIIIYHIILIFMYHIYVCT